MYTRQAHFNTDHLCFYS